MRFIPTIDVKSRHCVRLRSGNFNEVLVKLDVIQETERLVRSGTKRIHVVDLEGSLGRPNLRVIRSICNYAGRSVQVQVGGGLRSLRMIAAYFDVGATTVVLGTIALTNPKLVLEAAVVFSSGIGVGLDGITGCIVTHGWKQNTRHSPADYLDFTRAFGVGGMFCTSVKSDGSLSGLNLTDVISNHQNLTAPLVVSGGLSSAEELQSLAKAVGWLAGILCGSAVYRRIIEPKAAVEATGLSGYCNLHEDHSLS